MACQFEVAERGFIGNEDGKMAHENNLSIVRESLDFNSSQVSSIARYTNLGMLGTIWTSMVTDAKTIALDQAIMFGIPVLSALRISILIILVALLLDFAQYFAGYRRDLKALEKLESSKGDCEYVYDRRCNWRRASRCFFFTKLGLTFANLLWMIYTMATIIPA
jgi:hypothetical protein